jgi:hypothetical protein
MNHKPTETPRLKLLPLTPEQELQQACGEIAKLLVSGELGQCDFDPSSPADLQRLMGSQQGRALSRMGEALLRFHGITVPRGKP